MLTVMAEDTRRFVDCDVYVGPDRRVKQLTTFGFTLKRQSDFKRRINAYSTGLPTRMLQAAPRGERR
jgi:hypothetical protein